MQALAPLVQIRPPKNLVQMPSWWTGLVEGLLGQLIRPAQLENQLICPVSRHLIHPFRLLSQLISRVQVPFYLIRPPSFPVNRLTSGLKVRPLRRAVSSGPSWLRWKRFPPPQMSTTASLSPRRTNHNRRTMSRAEVYLRRMSGSGRQRNPRPTFRIFRMPVDGPLAWRTVCRKIFPGTAKF